MVKDARREEKDAGVDGVPAGQVFADTDDKALLVDPHPGGVVDLRQGAGLTVYAQRVTASGVGEQTLEQDGRDQVVGHGDDKGVVLDKGLAGEDGGGVAVPVVGVGQTADLDAVAAAVAQVALQQMALVADDDAQPGKAGLDKGFDGVIDQRAAQHRDQRFGKVLGQSFQPCAGSGSKYDAFHRPSSVCVARHTEKAGLAARLFSRWGVFTRRGGLRCRSWHGAFAAPAIGPVFHGYGVSCRA